MVRLAVIVVMLLTCLMPLSSLRFAYGVPISDYNINKFRSNTARNYVGKVNKITTDETDESPPFAASVTGQEATVKIDNTQTPKNRANLITKTFKEPHQAPFEAEQSETDARNLAVDEVASQLEVVPSSAEFGPTEVAAMLQNLAYKINHTPVLIYPIINDGIAEKVYVERRARDASQSAYGSEDKLYQHNPYMFGYTKLPDTQVLNSKECVEHHLSYVMPPLVEKGPQRGRFVSTKKPLEKHCVIRNAYYNGPIILIANCNALRIDQNQDATAAKPRTEQD